MPEGELKSAYGYKGVSSNTACKKQKAKQLTLPESSRAYVWKSPMTSRSYVFHFFRKSAPQDSDRNIKTACGRLPISEVTTDDREYVGDMER